MNIQFIVAFDFIDRGRDDPAEEKNAHNDEPDGIKVKIPKHIPESTSEPYPIAKNAEHFDGANDECYQDGDKSNIQVVVKLAYRFDKGPAVGTQHQDPVGCVEEHHTGHE